MIRQPTHAVIGGPTRPHPVTRNARITARAAPALAGVVPRREDGATGADRKIGLPLRPCSGIGVQLERSTKGLPAICGADVIDVTRIATGAVLSINVMHDTVERGRLAPALMPPVTTAISKHAGEVAHRGNARPRKAGAAVGVAPGVAAIGRPEDEIRIVVREAAASFIHPGDVHVAGGQVAGNLDIADERRAAGDLPRVCPSETIVSGVANE